MSSDTSSSEKVLSSKDPVASAAKGATKAFLEYSEEKIKQFIEKFKNRDIAFVEDPEIIDIAKEIRETGELDLFKKYVDDKEFRILFQMGLTLRRLEKENKPIEPLKILKKKIVNKYDIKGLHIAYFVQNGFFSKYIGNVLERASTPNRLTFEIKNLFENIDNTVMFVRTTDKIDQKTSEIIAKIQANSPKTFIISSIGLAMNICEKIKDKVLHNISNYKCELYESEDKRIYFLNRIDDIL